MGVRVGEGEGEGKGVELELELELEMGSLVALEVARMLSRCLRTS
jgi:hypothetical protein